MECVELLVLGLRFVYCFGIGVLLFISWLSCVDWIGLIDYAFVLGVLWDVYGYTVRRRICVLIKGGIGCCAHGGNLC